MNFSNGSCKCKRICVQQQSYIDNMACSPIKQQKIFHKDLLMYASWMPSEDMHQGFILCSQMVLWWFLSVHFQMPTIKELYTAGEVVCTAPRSHVRTKVGNSSLFYGFFICNLFKLWMKHKNKKKRNTPTYIYIYTTNFLYLLSLQTLKD